MTRRCVLGFLSPRDDELHLALESKPQINSGSQQVIATKTFAFAGDAH
jgi:hypothetical protein